MSTATARDVIARAIQPASRQHGQLCPVWRNKRPLSDCDCWIKGQVYGKADAALEALREAGFEVPA